MAGASTRGIKSWDYQRWKDGTARIHSAPSGAGGGTTLRGGYFKHHWSYYKAKAVARGHAAKKEG